MSKAELYEQIDHFLFEEWDEDKLTMLIKMLEYLE